MSVPGLHRITSSCLRASWNRSGALLPLGCAPRQRALLLLLLLFMASTLLLLGLYQRRLWAPPQRSGTRVNRFLSMEAMEATDVSNPALNYGVVVDCGSSGSRVFVYYWPPHNGNPHTLLDIRQMRDRQHVPVVKKIKPGESSWGGGGGASCWASHGGAGGVSLTSVCSGRLDLRGFLSPGGTTSWAAPAAELVQQLNWSSVARKPTKTLAFISSCSLMFLLTAAVSPHLLFSSPLLRYLHAGGDSLSGQ